MIMQDLDVLRFLVAPSEYDPPAIVYTDRMLLGETPSQGFQAIPRGRREMLGAPFEARPSGARLRTTASW